MTHHTSAMDSLEFRWMMKAAEGPSKKLRKADCCIVGISKSTQISKSYASLKSIIPLFEPKFWVVYPSTDINTFGQNVLRHGSFFAYCEEGILPNFIQI